MVRSLACFGLPCLLKGRKDALCQHLLLSAEGIYHQSDLGGLLGHGDPPVDDYHDEQCQAQGAARPAAPIPVV